MSASNWFVVVVVVAVVLGILALKARRMDRSRAKMRAEGATYRVGDIRLTKTALLIGDRSYPLEGMHATVEDTGTVNRRYTLTRMFALGIAAAAVPKKLDDRDVYVTVEGPGVAEVRVVHVKDNPNAGAIARQFAAQLNMLATATPATA